MSLYISSLLPGVPGARNSLFAGLPRAGYRDVDYAIGTRFSGGEINYTITGALDTPGAYSLTAETPGEIGNDFYGTLLPIDFVDGLAGAELEDRGGRLPNKAMQHGTASCPH